MVNPLFKLVEGLKFLVRICSDLGLADTQEYANKLKKAEKMKEVQQAVWKLRLLFLYFQLECLFAMFFL